LQATQAISSQEAIPRSIRHFPSRTNKAFDTLHHRHAQDSLQIEALQKKEDELENKRQKKIAVDRSQVFVDTTRIKAAQEAARQRETWEEQGRAAEARRTSIVMLVNQIAQFQHELDRN